jgi:hypothetical protein
MNALRPNIAGEPDTNTVAVLYGLLQAQNPELTVPLASISFGPPQLNTQSQSAANGNTSSNTQVSAAGFGDPVTISYNQVVVANSVLQPNNNVGGYSWNANSVPVLNAPPGNYATSLDFTAALQAAGFPVTSGDIENVALQNFWTEDYSGYYYQSLGYQYLPWSDVSLGYTSGIWVTYGPATPVPLATAFPQSYFEVLQTCDACYALAAYNNYYLSQNQSPEGSGAGLTRACTTYSGLTILDSGTSTANGGAEVSAVVTYETNPNYLALAYSQQPFWPFYSGAQTVYYTRYAPTNVGTILTNNSGNGYSLSLDGIQPFLVDGAFRFPLGPGLASNNVATAHDLVELLTFVEWNIGFDLTDVVDGPLPTTYGEDGTVVYNLTFQNSYMVQDGEMPITLMQTGPDMSVIPAGVTDFPSSTFEGLWGSLLVNTDGKDALATAVWNWLCNNYYTVVNNYNQDEPSNWMFSCVATTVAGSVQPTTSEVAAAHSGCGFQATINIVTLWSASFQFPIYFDQINLSTLGTAFSGNLGVANLQTASNVFAVPQRVIDWVLSEATALVSAPDSSLQLATFLNYREFTNLNDLVLPGDDGNLSFTLTAPEGSNLTQGSLTVIIANASSQSPAETSQASPNGGIGWKLIIPF